MWWKSRHQIKTSILIYLSTYPFIPFTLRLSIQQFQAPHASAPMLCWFTSLGSYFYCFLCLDCSFFLFPFLPYLLCLDNPTYPLRPSSGSPFPGSLPWPSPYPQHVGLYTSLCILIQICVFITLNFNHLFTQLTVSLYRIEGPQEQACGWDEVWLILTSPQHKAEHRMSHWMLDKPPHLPQKYMRHGVLALILWRESWSPRGVTWPVQGPRIN